MRKSPWLLLLTTITIFLLSALLLMSLPLWRGNQEPTTLGATFASMDRESPRTELSPCEREPSLRLQPGVDLQRAVDEAPPGAIVALAAGTYTVPDRGLRITKSLALCGEDRLPTTTVIQASETLSADNLLHVFCVDRGPIPCEGPIRVWLEGLTLDGSPQPFRGQATNLGVEGQVQLTFHRGWVVESIGSGIRVAGGAEIVLEDISVANNNDTGILLRGGRAVLQRVRVLRSWGRFGPSYGIVVDEDSAAVIQDSWIMDNGTGVLARSVTDDPSAQGAQVRIERSWIIGNLAGLYLLKGSNVSVRRTFIQDNQEGILFEEGQLSLEDSEIAYNYNRGVFLGAAVLAIFNDNLIHDNDFGIAINIQTCSWAGVPLGPEEFTGRLEGMGNKIYNNWKMDLCPEEFPWPEGFEKP